MPDIGSSVLFYKDHGDLTRNDLTCLTRRDSMATMVSPEIRQARAFLKRQRSQLVEELKRIEKALVALEDVGQPAASATGSKRQGSVREKVEEVMRENRDRVLHADEVLELVRSKGVVITSSDPKATIVTPLLRLKKAGKLDALGRNRFKWKGAPVDPDDLPFE